MSLSPKVLKIIPKKKIPKNEALVFKLSSYQTGFILQHESGYSAFLNECCHLPTPLDDNDEKLLTQDRKLIQCQHHGALYDKKTGVCIEGPCQGEKLVALEIEVQGDKIVILSTKELLNVVPELK